MKQAVIFDMDGVLVDTESFYFKRRMKFFDDLKIEPATRKIEDFIGSTNGMIWEMLVPDDEKRNILKEEYLKYCKEHEVCFQEILNPSVKEVIRELKDRNIKIAIASSSERKEILRMVEECGIASCIDFVISGEECTQSKPDPEIYIRAIKALELLETEVLAVEDSALGIRAAKAAGLTVVALAPRDYYIDQSEADYKVNDLIEITSKI
ncbi:HAD family hydrolase [Clostridium beijerinckii]|uniref:HAD superfamily hydrolase (TIGR01509 family) n=1 Tax=Clostridium beijerinckii TaxID=1520 RepID=A0AAE5H1N9_CLOBE|nr:HAD family phosphatase [Clostridium beijerinckii]NSB12697.1 HAD superfamily hydrolase (TIGR01509 family) [Clostridium beijerinckii]OOM30047.1 phosphorylated carbohydrates phosphatase [Clostridium beijerinckii]